jgi:hypothetical protein
VSEGYSDFGASYGEVTEEYEDFFEAQYGA